MVDNGRASTYLLAAIGVIYAIVMGLQAAGLVQIGVPEKYAASIVLVVSIIYDVAFPRNSSSDKGIVE